MAEAILKTEDTQPVEPAPVETSTPLEDWTSDRSPQEIRYIAETWLLAPRNRSYSKKTMNEGTVLKDAADGCHSWIRSFLRLAGQGFVQK
jgi:hypothetical protein